MPDDDVRRSMLDVAVEPGSPTTVTLAGEVDPATAPELEACLLELAADGAVTEVVLDLRQVTFLDSSGLRTLVAANEALRERSVHLSLRDPSANIRRVLEVTGLTELIDLE